MTTEVYEGEYIINDKAFDDIYVFLDIETYLYRGIEEAGFGENRKLEYLVNLQNKALMVLENNEILFGMKMKEHRLFLASIRQGDPCQLRFITI